MKIALYLFASVLSLLSFFSHGETLTKNPLLGSWRMLEVHWKSVDATHSIKNAQPGIFLFTPKSYSIMWTPTKEVRKSFEILSKPTDKEAISGFKSVVFNAGRYSLTQNTLETVAYIAKVPGFEGGKQFYKYSIKNNILTLEMVDETYPDGSKPEWSGTWSTEFILQRI